MFERNCDLCRVRFRLNNLRTVTVARIRAHLAPLLFVSKVVIDLGLKQPLHHGTFQACEDPIRPEQITFGVGSCHQLIKPFGLDLGLTSVAER